MRKFDKIEKRQILNEIKNSELVNILNKYNISKSTLYYWLKQDKEICDYYKKKLATYYDYEKPKRKRLELILGCIVS